MASKKAPTKQLTWHEAPVKTTWGAGMMCADISLSKDETLTIYAHKNALHLVAKVLQVKT